MDSYDDVIVYQVEQKNCAKCFSPVDSVEIVRNLLPDNQDFRKFRTVSSTEFKPWYDSKRLVPLSLKFLPPKLALDSVKKSKPTADDKAQSTSHDLLEFSPVYSGKSFLRTQLGKCSHFNSHECCAEDHNISEDCNPLPVSAREGDDDNRASTNPEEVLNALAKPVRSTLEKVLGNIGEIQFWVHPVGAVMDL